MENIVTFESIKKGLEEAGEFGNVELNNGNPYAWEKEPVRDWNFELQDIKKQYRADSIQLSQLLNPIPKKETLLSNIIGGVESAITRTKDYATALEITGLEYISPSMNDDEAKMIMGIVGRKLLRNKQEQQEEFAREGVNPESFTFGATNAIGQAIMTTIAGIATGGSALPIVLSAGQTIASKKVEYATKFVEKGGNLSQQPAKDDWIALGLGAIDGLLSRGIGAERIFSQIATKGLKKQIVTTTAGEASEEFIQEYVEFAGNKVAGYEDRTYGELMIDSLKSAIFGGLAGGTMGTGMYMVHRGKLQKAYEDMGYESTEAKQKAIDTIDTGKAEVLREMKSRAELQLQFGDAYAELEGKIKAQVEATGKPENIKGDIEEYSQAITKTFANQILNVAAIKGVSVNDVINMADIEQEGTILELNTPDMKDEVDLRRRLNEKKEQIRVLKEQSIATKAKQEEVTGETTEESKLNLQIKRLENKLSKLNAPNTEEETKLKKSIEDKKEQVKGLRLQKTDTKLDIQTETLNKQVKALEERLERIKSNKDISDRNRAKQGLPKAKAHATQAVKDGKRLVVGVNANNFFETLNDVEKTKLTNSDGSINNVAVQRKYNDAVLASVINDPIMFERYILSGDISQEIQDKIVKAAETIANHNQNYAGYSLNEDLKEAIRFLDNTTIENFAEKAVTIYNENTFGGITMAYALLHSNNGNARFDRFLSEYTDNIDVYSEKGNPLSIKNDILAETLKYSQITEGKFDTDGITNDKNLLSVYANINNIKYENNLNLEPDTSGIYPEIRREAAAIKVLLKDTFAMRVTEKGKSLTTFIRDLGGIYDFGGELAARGIKSDIAKKSQTNKKGKRYVSLDYLLEKAFDAGYFPDKETHNDITHDEMIAAIENDYFGDKMRSASKIKENTKIKDNLEYLQSLDEMGITAQDSVEDIAIKLQQYYIDNELPLSNMITAEEMPDYMKDITLNGFELYQTDIKDGYVRLYRGLEQPFNKNYDISNTDAPQGYSTWTDNPELARQYAGENGRVYYIDLPKSELGKEIVDQNGERPLFIDNEKKAGLNNISGKEYLVYTYHDNYDVNQIKEFNNGKLKTDSEAFKKWFGDSKVVDSEDKPLVVYHGSNSKFDAFDITKAGQASSVSKVGFWFSPQKDFAENFAKDIWYGKDGENVYPVYLSMKNPKIYETTGEGRNDDAYAKFKIDIYEIDGQPADNATVGGLGMMLNSQSSVSKFRDKLKQEGYDGIIIKNTRYDRQTAGGNNDQYVAFDPTQIKSVNNKGEFNPNDPNIYNQRKRVNASYNINTKEIILGKNFNSMSLPHEMSHFWLDYIFNDVNLWRNGGQRSGLYLQQIGELWDFLGVKDTQRKLTKDQQELFATLTEQYLTQRTALPIGTEFAVKDYLQYVPDAYNTFLDFGYIDSKGKVQNPIMTKEVKEWFDRFFTAWTSPDSPAPEIVSLYVPSEEPATDTVQTERATDIESTAAKEKSFTESIIKAVDDSVPVADKIDMAVKAKNYEQQAKDILLPPETSPKEDKFSFVRFGRGTNKREGMSKEAVKWVKSNQEKALSIAMGDPRYIENDSPIERGMLIRAVMEANPTLQDTLKINFALSKSLSGKTLGLNNDTSDSMFLIGLGKAENNYLNKYLLKRYGNKPNAAEKLERELDKFVNGFAPRIINASPAEISTQIKNMLDEANKIFGTAEQNELFQTDIPRSVLKDRNKFIDFAKQLVRKHVGALPSDSYVYELMNLATRAQLAAPDLNSDDTNTAVAAAKEIREYQNYLIQTEIPLTIMDKIIGGFASRSMLSGISTHLKNLISNSLEIPMVRTALTAKYGKSEVSESLIRAEADRMTKIYEETLISLPQMHTLNDRSLIAGEIYRIANTNSVTIGGVKINTIGNTSIPDPLALLGRSDFFFRRIAYLQTLAHIATYEAKKTGKSPDELFMQYKQIGAKESSDTRLEAVLVSNIAVFTHNGELSRVIGSIRRTLDDYTAGAMGANQFGLGTIVSPFVKTPSNILQLGAEAMASPFVIAKKKIKGEEISIKNYVDVAHLVSAVTLAAVILSAGCDYEPPYKVGNKYDPKKHYDSIKIGSVWVKLDVLGVLSMPLRLMIAAKDIKTWSKAAEGTIGELPLDFGGLEYAITQPSKGVPYFAESQLTKLIPAITSITRPFVRESGATMPTYGKIGSQLAKRIGLDGKKATINDYIHILLSSISVEE